MVHLARFFPELTRQREFQLFLVGYMIVEICEIYTVGGFPLDRKVRLVRLALLPICTSKMLTTVGLYRCSSRFNRCNPMGSALERYCRVPDSG